MALAVDGHSFTAIERLKHLLDVPIEAKQLQDNKRVWQAENPRLEPSAAIKHIMVTGGNGFVYVF